MVLNGFILAGGSSLRFGENKAFYPFNDHSFIEQIISVIQPYCSQIFINGDELTYEKLGYKCIDDNFSDIGPIGGIEACLISSDTDYNLILSCDVPFITEEVIENLILSVKPDSECNILESKKGVHPLIGIYHKKANEKIHKAINNKNYRLRQLIAKLDSNIIDVNKLDGINEHDVANINTKDAFEKWKKNH